MEEHWMTLYELFVWSYIALYGLLPTIFIAGVFQLVKYFKRQSSCEIDVFKNEFLFVYRF